MRPDEDVDSFDWLPNNRLIYAADQSIYITPQNSVTAKGSEIVTFPDNVGRPIQLAVSPDGSQLAFTLLPPNTIFLGAKRGTTWVLDLYDDNLRQLTNMPDSSDPDSTSDDPVINFPTWSPDGRWIAVVEAAGVPCYNVPDLGSVSDPSQCVQTQDSLYIVPSDGENVMLTDKKDITTSAVLIYSYFDDVHDYIDNPELDSRFNMGDRGILAWLP